MKKNITIYDIAKALNITVSTVSRALNDIPTISESTKESVLKMAKKLNYRPNKLASSLTSGKTYTLGVIIPSAQINFFATVVSSIEQVLKKHNYQILLYQSNESFEDESKGIKTLLEAQVDGIIASPSLETQDTSHFQYIIEQNKPLIIFDRTIDKLKAPSVKLDDFEAGYLVCKHLLDAGYERIAYVTTNKEIKIFEDRYKGYKQALKDYGRSLTRSFTVKGELSIDAGRQAAQALFQGKKKPDAVIGGDDFTAVGIIQGIKELGLSVPEIGVIGFANQSFSSLITPTLSSIDQQAVKMGEQCAKLFLEMVDRKLRYEEIAEVIVAPILVERESTKLGKTSISA